MRFLKAGTKREAVVAALRDFNRRHRMARLVRFSGTCDFEDNAAMEQVEAGESGR